VIGVPIDLSKELVPAAIMDGYATANVLIAAEAERLLTG
jgi:hypothetical protein